MTFGPSLEWTWNIQMIDLGLLVIGFIDLMAIRRSISQDIHFYQYVLD